MSFHFPWEAATNEPTTDISDPIAETPEFKACAVRIEHLLPVTIGNIVGGALLVGAVYWFVYLRPR